MAIKKEEYIVASDVRNRLQENLENIRANLQSIENIGIQAEFFGPNFNNIISSLEPSQYHNFLNNYNSLKTLFNDLSSSFNVKSGEPIKLSGFYTYALSCHTAASYIRHTVYVLYQNNLGNVLKYHNASYLKQIPTMRALIPPENKIGDNPLRYKDFRVNWAENTNQQNLSSIEKLLSENDGNTMWIFKDYGYGNLFSYVNYYNFSDTTKKLHIGSVCNAGSTSNLLNLLRDINYDIGHTISCLYYWVDKKSKFLPTVNVIYDVDRYSNIITRIDGGNIISPVVDSIDQFSYYRVKSLSDIGWKLKTNMLVMTSWINKKTGEIWSVNDVRQITETTTLIPNVNGELFLNCDIWAYYEGGHDSGGTTIITNYLINNYGNDITIENGIVTIRGLQGFSYAEIDFLECGVNEAEDTHWFQVDLVDLNTGMSAKLINYEAAWQSPFYVEKYAKFVYSCYPRNEYAGRITLAISSEGIIKFQLVATYDGTDNGSRQFFMESLTGLINNGGIHNFIIHM